MNKNRTIIVDFGNENHYENIISDGKAFLEFVVAYILSLGFQLLHKEHCTGGNCFTRHSHYVRIRCGGITIWRIQCKKCKAVFTVQPSFLMRYTSCKTEEVKKALTAYHGGLSFENCAICFNVSPIALYRLICALGKYSISEISNRMGVDLPKHVQVDEKHTKCLGEKGYIPIISSGHQVWHIDYVESLNEDILENSYQSFANETRKINADYSPKTITHDGFKSTINALHNIFKKASVYLICWLHACRSLAKLIRPFSKEEGDKLSKRLLKILNKCHSKKSLQRISLRSYFNALLRDYKKVLPDEFYGLLDKWIKRRKPYLYDSMDHPKPDSFSCTIDHICNHFDRKLFMMKYFHHPKARIDLFLKGLHLFILLFLIKDLLGMLTNLLFKLKAQNFLILIGLFLF